MRLDLFITLGLLSLVSARSAPSRITVSEAKSVHKSTGQHSSVNKKGLGVNSLGDVTAFGKSVSWAYNWYTQSPSGRGHKLPNSVQNLPMLWNAKTLGQWPGDVKAAINSGSKFILGFNEPDLGSQANMSPQAAAALWKRAIDPVLRANPHVQACSPAVTNGGGAMGINWLQRFMKACKGCKIDAVCLHFYAPPSSIAYFKSYFTTAQKVFKGKPIFITEFGPSQGSIAQRQSFIRQTVPWLRSQKGIARFAAFGLDSNAPFVKNGKLTALGKTYRDA